MGWGERHGDKSDRQLLFLLLEQQGVIVAAIDDLNSAISTLTTDVNALIALQQQGDQSAAIASATANVQALDQQVTAITQPPTTA